VNGIIINAAATDVVTIRGISINGFCNGINGINILQAKTVNVEDCVIFRFNTGNGITVNETSSTGLNLNVRNSVIRDNTLDGINTTSSTGNVNVTLEHVSLIGNGNGFHARSGTRATARNCVFSNNATNGVFGDAQTASLVNVFVWDSQTLNQNQIDRNTGNGISITAPGVVNTFGNNSILGNGVDGCAGCNPVGPGA
jgi:hypothetical protein